MAEDNRQGSRFVGMTAAVLALFLVYSFGTHAMDTFTVTSLTSRMQTVCVGRFLIDLPQAMRYQPRTANVGGFWVFAVAETGEAFAQRVAQRQRELQAWPEDAPPHPPGAPHLERAQRLSLNGFDVHIFQFGRQSLKGMDRGRETLETNIRHEAYAHMHGWSFDFRVDYSDPEDFERLKALIARLRLIEPGAIPDAPGLCVGPGLFADPLPVGAGEGMGLFASIPGRPGLAMVFSSSGRSTPDAETRLQRDLRVDAGLPLWARAMMTKLRQDKRSVHGIEGDEVVERWQEPAGVSTFSFHWEFNGTRDDVLRPFLHLEMSTGHPAAAGGKRVPSPLGEEALLALWDQVVSTIRVRPTRPRDQAAAPADAPKPEPGPGPGPAPGDTAAAGEPCPGSGWWQCAAQGKGLRVWGGPRQYLKQGQRMPQALLLPPQTVWEKPRGLQSSREAQAPTRWTLVDRRYQPRPAGSAGAC
jgi:hypothetical protein